MHSVWQGIRLWGQKMPNFGARREKIRQTNVKLNFLIFHVLKLDFFYLNVGLTYVKQKQQTHKKQWKRDGEAMGGPSQWIHLL